MVFFPLVRVFYDASRFLFLCAIEKYPRGIVRRDGAMRGEW